MSRHATGLMDRLMHNFNRDHPDYVRKFGQARIIIDRGTRHEDGPDTPPKA